MVELFHQLFLFQTYKNFILHFAESNNNEECDKMNEKSEIITENMGINLETVSRALQNLVEFGILHSSE